MNKKNNKVIMKDKVHIENIILLIPLLIVLIGLF